MDASSEGPWEYRAASGRETKEYGAGAHQARRRTALETLPPRDARASVLARSSESSLARIRRTDCDGAWAIRNTVPATTSAGPVRHNKHEDLYRQSSRATKFRRHSWSGPSPEPFDMATMKCTIKRLVTNEVYQTAQRPRPVLRIIL